jgi:hypothetical protein
MWQMCFTVNVWSVLSAALPPSRCPTSVATTPVVQFVFDPTTKEFQHCNTTMAMELVQDNLWGKTRIVPLCRLVLEKVGHAHPLLTKGITRSMIAGTGDFICQYLIDKREKEHAMAPGGGDGSTTNTIGATSISWLWW